MRLPNSFTPNLLLTPNENLIECGKEDAERAGEGEPDFLFAAEKFDKGTVGGLRKEHHGDVGNDVVHPMENEAGHDAVRAVVEPTEQQAE